MPAGGTHNAAPNVGTTAAASRTDRRFYAGDRTASEAAQID